MLEKKMPLILCAEQENLEGVRILLEADADLHRPDKVGCTLMIHAALNGHFHVLTFLMRTSGPTDNANTPSNSASHYATAYRWIECLVPLSELVDENINPWNN